MVLLTNPDQPRSGIYDANTHTVVRVENTRRCCRCKAGAFALSTFPLVTNGFQVVPSHAVVIKKEMKFYCAAFTT